MTISIASAVTTDWAYFLYILMASIKDHKRPATEIDYYVFVPYKGARDENYWRDYFGDLQDSTFHIHLTDVYPVLNRMGNLDGPPMTYVRCFLCGLFPELDRMLYLDSDMLCCKEGIEDLWEIDITDYYCAAAHEPAIIWSRRYQHERDNMGFAECFNAGMLLFNFDRIRRHSLDRDMEDWCAVWDYDVLKPYHRDQTLLNWLFHGHVKWVSSLYNNLTLASWGFKVDSFERQAAEEGYPRPLAMLPDTVFMHFCDHNKPWVAKLTYPEETYPYLLEARLLWRDAVRKYAKQQAPEQPLPEQEPIVIATQATLDRKENVYILLNSLRHNKKPATRIIFHLFVPQEEIPEFQKYLTGLPTDTFRVHIMDIDWFKDKVDTAGTIRNHLYYARCLFPQVFLRYDKLLYMDIDMACVGSGIEDLWDTDIDDYWVGAVIDPTWQYCTYFQHDPQNCGTNHYFNNGMMLMNLKLLREDGKDEEFAQWCLHWDKSRLLCHCFDQTLCNYLLKDKVKLLPFKYNNSVLASLGIAKDAYSYYLNQIGYLEPLDSLQHAVLVHFCGSKKPWDPEALACSYNEYPYKDEAVELWDQIRERYAKKEIPPQV